MMICSKEMSELVRPRNKNTDQGLFEPFLLFNKKTGVKLWNEQGVK